jgi:hypothetical protein
MNNIFNFMHGMEHTNWKYLSIENDIFVVFYFLAGTITKITIFWGMTLSVI